LKKGVTGVCCIAKQLCVCLAVYMLLTALLALELALIVYEIIKHVHLTQYQFRLFTKRRLYQVIVEALFDKTANILFRFNTVQL